MNIAWIGLGRMGTPMAERLVAAGHAVTVFSRAGKTIEGATSARDLPSAVRDAELVVTMLPDEHAVDDVVRAIAPALSSSAIVVEMSTIGRQAALDVSRLVPRFVDAPVSGSVGAATNGALVVLCGGEAREVDAARPALSVLGRVEHVGPIGHGAATKLVLNAIGAQQMVALTSGLELAQRMGLESARTLDLVQMTAFATRGYEGKRERVLGATLPPEFTIALWEKDQRLVLEEAARRSFPMPVLDAARTLMQRAIEAGLGEADMASLGALFADQSCAEQSDASTQPAGQPLSSSK